MAFDIKKLFKKKETKKPETSGEKLWSWIKTIFWAIIVVMIINGIAIASFVVPTGSMENTVMTGDFLFVNKFIYGPTSPQVVPFFNIPLPFFKFPAPKDPEKGDVIVFIFPGMREEVKSPVFQYYLKRCVATAGDTIQIINNHLFINGKLQGFPEHSNVDSSNYEDPTDKFRTFPAGMNFTRNNYGPIRIPKEGDIINLTQDNYRAWATFIAREGHTVDNSGTSILIDGKVVNTYKVERNYCFGMGDNRDHSLDSRYWGFIPYYNVVGTPMIVYWSWDTNLPMAKLFDKIGSIRFDRLLNIIR